MACVRAEDGNRSPAGRDNHLGSRRHFFEYSAQASGGFLGTYLTYAHMKHLSDKYLRGVFLGQQGFGRRT